MTTSLRFVLAAAVALPALQTEELGFVKWTAADLRGRHAALSARVGPDHSARETLAEYGDPSGSHRFRLIHRNADGVPEQHANIDDVVYVYSGAATLLVGGDLVDSTGGENGEYTGTDIAGGVRHFVGPGDILRIPADTPHRYLVPEQGYITYVLVRIPALLAGGVIPDDAPVLDLQPLGFVRWGADELARRDASLATRIRPDRSARETLADFGSPTRSHRFRFIHRDADGRPEIHDDIIDLVFVKSGAGVLLVGGEMLDRDGTFGSGIAGGTRYPVVAGDMIHIPAGTPHGYLVPDGGHITYVLVRVPAVL
jgi:mannose-6-phosphate isomerase-like protein (cupin superfamily)